MENEDTRSGVSWKDVFDLMMDMELRYQCSVTFFMHTKRSENINYHSNYVVLRVNPWIDTMYKENEVRRELKWPNRDHKTMPGLLLRLLYEAREEMLKLGWAEI